MSSREFELEVIVSQVVVEGLCVVGMNQGSCSFGALNGLAEFEQIVKR